MTTEKTYNSQTSQRLLKVLNWIKDNPEHWDQSVWHCGTSHCFAGVAQLMMYEYDPAKADVEGDAYDGFTVYSESKLPMGDIGSVADEASEWLGVTADQAEDLFEWRNTIEQLTEQVEWLCEQYG